MRRLSLIPAVLLALCLPLIGQTKDKPREVVVRLGCLQFVNNVQKLSLPKLEDGTSQVLPLRQGVFCSPTIVKFTGNTLDFVDAVTAPDGTVTSQTIASTAIPAGTKEASVLLLPPPPGGKLAYRAVLLPDTASFAYGQVLVMNMANTGMRIALGKKAAELQANNTKIIDPSGEKDGYNMVAVATAFLSPANNQWITTYTGKWQQTANNRIVAIASIDPISKKPKFSFGDEFKSSFKPRLADAANGRPAEAAVPAVGDPAPGDPVPPPAPLP